MPKSSHEILTPSSTRLCTTSSERSKARSEDWAIVMANNELDLEGTSRAGCCTAPPSDLQRRASALTPLKWPEVHHKAEAHSSGVVVVTG